MFSMMYKNRKLYHNLKIAMVKLTTKESAELESSDVERVISPVTSSIRNVVTALPSPVMSYTSVLCNGKSHVH